MIQKCETFSDVKKAALVLYEYCKKELEDKNRETINIKVKGKKNIDEMSDEELLDELEEELEESVEPQEGESYGGTAEKKENKGGETGGIEVRTADNLDITGIAIDSTTNIATVTCSDHSALGFGPGTQVVISGSTNHNGEYKLYKEESQNLFIHNDLNVKLSGISK